jgi:lysozyme
LCNQSAEKPDDAKLPDYRVMFHLQQGHRMKTGPRGVAFIAALEGVVTRAYRDVAGVWTIGIGHTAAAGPPKPQRGMTISRDEALAILAHDLPRYEKRVAAALPDCAQAAFDGAVSFDFNTGAIDRASWVKALRAGDEGKVRQQIALWNKAGGKVVGGLVKRRAAEARLILDGDYGDGAATNTSDTLARDLAALGYRGDDAVLRYQRAHPDLVPDGIAGPATRAAVARDLAARRGAAAGTIGAGAAAAAAAGLPWWVTAILALAFSIVAVAAAVRYRAELLRLFKRK